MIRLPVYEQKYYLPNSNFFYIRTYLSKLGKNKYYFFLFLQTKDYL
jgi:hypothetical protein